MKIQTGDTSIQNEQQTTYIHDSVKEWLTNYTSDRTIKSYTHILETFRVFNNGILIKATMQDIVDYRDYLIHDEQRANTTVNLHLYAIRAFYKNLVKKEIIAKSPAQDVNATKVQAYGKTQSLNIKLNEHEKLLTSIDTSTEMGARDYSIILLLLTTGLRVSAIVEATIASIEQSGQQTYLNFINKGGEQDRKELIPITLESLRHYFSFRIISDKSPLFATVRGGNKNPKHVFGKPMSRVAISKTITKCARQAGVSRVSAHGLRHTSAKYLRSLGYTVSQIQTFLGHKDRRTTLIYLDQLDKAEDEAKIAESMNNMFG